MRPLCAPKALCNLTPILKIKLKTFNQAVNYTM